MDLAQGWSAQQLVQFVALLSSSLDEESAIAAGLERAAEALDAEVAALTTEHSVVAAVGLAGTDLTDEQLIEAARSPKSMIELPVLGACAGLSALTDHNSTERVVVLRCGGEFSQAEAGLLRGMAQMMAMALRNLRLLEAERALRRHSERQAQDALRDPLTRLANRAVFLDRLNHCLLRRRSDDSPCAVLFMDLDRFKVVNDTMGHAAGDALLVGVAERIVSCLRPEDTVARLGGDEFAILIEDVADKSDPAAVCERLLLALGDPIAISGVELLASSSIGVAVSDGFTTASDLLRYADLAMYAAKSRGGARYMLFDARMDDAIQDRLVLEADLRRALVSEQFVLYYQPIRNLASDHLHGFEALVRWNHPTRGLVPPNEFIPVAEESGLILGVGRWVLAEACQQLRRWRDAFPAAKDLSMSVNLSPRQLSDPNIVADVGQAIKAAGIPPGAITLEVTETVLVSDVATTRSAMEALKAIGVRLAVDDFGTGYSSLSYLSEFPVDTLKIDKSFVDGVGWSPDADALAKAIINVGQALRLQTVAEGIETDEQLAELRHAGCDLGQGYHLSYPLDALHAESVLAAFEAERATSR